MAILQNCLGDFRFMQQPKSLLDSLEWICNCKHLHKSHKPPNEDKPPPPPRRKSSWLIVHVHVHVETLPRKLKKKKKRPNSLGSTPERKHCKSITLETLSDLVALWKLALMIGNCHPEPFPRRPRFHVPPVGLESRHLVVDPSGCGISERRPPELRKLGTRGRLLVCPLNHHPPFPS